MVGYYDTLCAPPRLPSAALTQLREGGRRRRPRRLLLLRLFRPPLRRRRQQRAQPLRRDGRVRGRRRLRGIHQEAVRGRALLLAHRRAGGRRLQPDLQLLLREAAAAGGVPSSHRGHAQHLLQQLHALRRDVLQPLLQPQLLQQRRLLLLLLGGPPAGRGGGGVPSALRPPACVPCCTTRRLFAAMASRMLGCTAGRAWAAAGPPAGAAAEEEGCSAGSGAKPKATAALLLAAAGAAAGAGLGGAGQPLICGRRPGSEGPWLSAGLLGAPACCAQPKPLRSFPGPRF